jgi:hypothetical protein
LPEEWKLMSGPRRLFACAIGRTPVPTCQDGRTLNAFVCVLQPPPLPLQPTSVMRAPVVEFTFAVVPPTSSTSGS